MCALSSDGESGRERYVGWVNRFVLLVVVSSFDPVVTLWESPPPVLLTRVSFDTRKGGEGALYAAQTILHTLLATAVVRVVFFLFFTFSLVLVFFSSFFLR